MSSYSLGLCEAAELLASGGLNSQTLTADCQSRIAEFESGIHAWAWHSPDYVTVRSQRADDYRMRGKPLGRLHGVPIGIKDIIDTAGIPTEHGFAPLKGRVPRKNAVLIDKLLSHGAIIMGKTVTTPLATSTPSETLNPHNPAHSPGGSSSGSAAAVASYMVPAAVGTQTNGSVIRPAAYCGVVGFKPSFGLISRTGVLRQSPFLDQVGTFGRSVEDAALLAETVIGDDPLDLSTLGKGAVPPLLDICRSEPPVEPKFAFLRTSRWSQLDASSQAGLEEVIAELSDRAEEITLGDAFESAWEAQQLIHSAEMATWYGSLYQKNAEHCNDDIRQMIEFGRSVAATDYINAMESRAILNCMLDEYFNQYDVIVAPAAPGAAPAGLESTGDPMFSTPWTFCGVPAITVPLLRSESGLPIGVQLIGQYMDDARLLRTANWMMKWLA